MKIQVERVTETPTTEDFAITRAWWEARPAADPAIAEALAEPLALRVSLHRMGQDLYLEGEADGHFDLACSRCVTRYRQPVRERFRLVLEPAGSRVPADPEGARTLASEGLYLSDELESGWFGGSEIHLDRFVTELVALVFPVQPICREDCRGLCPQCGIDRNLESCECAEARGDSPFAVLQALRRAPHPE